MGASDGCCSWPLVGLAAVLEGCAMEAGKAAVHAVCGRRTGRYAVLWAAVRQAAISCQSALSLQILSVDWGSGGPAESVLRNIVPLFIEQAGNRFGYADPREAEVEIADYLFGPLGRPHGVCNRWVFLVPGLRKPVIDPFAAIIRHVINPKRIGRQTATNRNGAALFRDPFI